MLPHRSDTSQGHLHPPLALVLHCLSLFFLLSLSLLKLRLDLTIAPPGWFLPCGRLCRHFPGGACASPLLPPSRHYPVFATTRTPRNPRPLNATLDDATAIVYASNLSTPKQNDTPPDRGEKRSFTRFLELPIVRSRASTTTVCSRKMSCLRIGRERATIEEDFLACDLRLLFEAFAFIRTWDF